MAHSASHDYVLHVASGQDRNDLAIVGGGPRPVPLPPAGVFTVFNGTSGNDTFTGTNTADTFNMAGGGDDTVDGRSGVDTFNFGAAMTVADTIDGGNGLDTVVLAGDYSGVSALSFGSSTMRNVEILRLSGGSFTLTAHSATVGAGAGLQIDATALTSAQMLIYDSSAETNGSTFILGGAGVVLATGGASLEGFTFGAAFNPASRLDGGGGTFDFLTLNGDYSAGLLFNADTIRNIETVNLTAGHDYTLTLDNANVTVGHAMTIDGSSLVGNAIVIDGSDETSSSLTILGGTGGDTIFGGGAADTLVTGGGGADVIRGGDGDDDIMGFFDFSASDSIDGGDGRDVLHLDGNYSALLALGANTLRHVEMIAIAAGHDYNLQLHNHNIDFGETLTVDASALNPSDKLILNASAIADGRVRFLGGAGTAFVSLGEGDYIVKGGSGQEVINAFGNLTEDDRLDGGGGNADQLTLQGDYFDMLHLASRTMRNFEVLDLSGGGIFRLKMADGNVVNGETLSVFAAASSFLVFDGSAEHGGRYTVTSGGGGDAITGGDADDTIYGGAGFDAIDATHGGNDTIYGGADNDTVYFGAELTAADIVDPGAGTDKLYLDGDYGLGLTLPNFEFVFLAAGHSYSLSASLPGGMTMQISPVHLAPDDALTFDGSESSGSLSVTGGRGADALTGGSGNDALHGGQGGFDTLRGSLGKDTLTAGGDTFVYASAAESTSLNYDTVLFFMTTNDRFDVPGAIGGHEATITSGTLSDTSAAVFDSNLSAAVSGLQPQHYLIFKPNSGTLSGHAFLIVDLNNATGYQANADLVVEITGYQTPPAPNPAEDLIGFI